MKRKTIISINGIDTDLIEIDVTKYKWVATEKGKSFIRIYYKSI